MCKFNETAAPNRVAVFMLLVRLPAQGADLLATCNSPVHLHRQSSSSRPGAPVHAVDAAEFAQWMATLAIDDYGIFNGS